MTPRNPSAGEGRQESDFWVIQHKERVVAVIRAQGELHAKKQAIAWVRGRTRQGVMWRDIQVRPQASKVSSSRIAMSKFKLAGKANFAKSGNAGQSVALVGLLVVMAWLWRDLI